MLDTIKKGKTQSLNKSRNLVGIVYAIPIILGFLLFHLVPMASSFYLSLTDSRTAAQTYNFIGLGNYIHALTGQSLHFGDSVSATIQYVLFTVPGTLIFTFLIALLLNTRIKFLSFYRTVFFIPNIVPIVAVSVIWMWIYHPSLGILNNFLGFLGVRGPFWLADRSWVIPSLAFMAIWTGGNLMVIFLAGLQDCPRHLYEAIAVDGGNTFHRFRYITLPFMTPVIFFNLIMQTIATFQVFAQILMMTGGGPNNASLVLNFYIYREAFVHHNMGYASALSWVLFVAIFTLTILYFATAKYWVYYSESESGGKR